MDFTKMHGAGNDYIYIDARHQERNWRDLTIQMSDRHTGVGSDGMILLKESQTSDLRMQMFNADGSEGKMCGNGIRCLVAFAINQGMIPQDTSPVIVETLAGNLKVTPIWENNKITYASVSMGKPNFEPQSLHNVATQNTNNTALMDYPLEVNDQNLIINVTTIGNLHAVTFVETPVETYDLTNIGPLVENHSMFPDRTNFEIVNVLNRRHLKVRVWERGTGRTLACGTGACAVAVICHIKNLVDDKVTVSLPGGDLMVEWNGQDEVIMEGPVEEVFHGKWITSTP